MASASAGRSSGKSSARFGGLRTATKRKGGRYATKSEVASNKSANDKMAKSFKRSVQRMNRLGK